LDALELFISAKKGFVVIAWLGLAGKNIQNTVRRLLSAQEPFKPCLNPTTPVPRPRALLFSDL